MTGKNLRKITIALNVLYAKKEKIYHAYVLKHNSNCEKQVIFLMISKGEKGHYLAVKKFPTLQRGITSKHHGYFYCPNCLHSFFYKNLSFFHSFFHS